MALLNRSGRNDVVAAAGGVVWRAGPDGGVEVALVHRPRYDDWSFPKGKRHRGETAEECAVREVEEETGVVGVLGHPLPEISYPVEGGRQKVVHYWTMAVVAAGPFEPNDETDELVWLGPPQATQRLSYGHDQATLAAAIVALRGETA